MDWCSAYNRTILFTLCGNITAFRRIIQMPLDVPTIFAVTTSSVMVACGVVGNGAVITLICRVLFTSNVKATVYIYILFLSIIDMIYLVSQPFSISYEIAGTWLFDTFTCRLNIGAEIINKTLSVYILVILSGDRYTAICNPLSTERRDVRKASAILAGTTFLVFLGNIPMYIYTQVTVIVKTPDLTITICRPIFPKFGNASIWDHSELYYAVYLEIFFFCVPACLIVTFYSLLLAQLRKRETSKRIQRQMIRRGKVTKSIMVVILFYFGCWGPYWIFQIAAIFGYSGYDTIMSTVIAKLVYLLPLANSSFNPILYGVLNQRLRKQYQESVQRDRQRRANRSKFEDDKRFSFSFQRRDTIISHFFPPRQNHLLAEVTELVDGDGDSRFSSISSRLSRYSVGNIFSSQSSSGRLFGLLRGGNSMPSLTGHEKVCKNTSHPYSIPEEDSNQSADKEIVQRLKIAHPQISISFSDITDKFVNTTDLHSPLHTCYSEGTQCRAEGGHANDLSRSGADMFYLSVDSIAE